MVEVFQRFEAEGLAVFHEGRIYVTGELVDRALATVPGVDEFFVPLDSYFIGGTAPYVYDDQTGQGGLPPNAEQVVRLAQIADRHPAIAAWAGGSSSRTRSSR